MRGAPSQQQGVDARNELGSIACCHARLYKCVSGAWQHEEVSVGWLVILILYLFPFPSKLVEFSICILQGMSPTYGAELRLIRFGVMLSLGAFLCLSHRSQKTIIHPVYE